MNVNKVVEILQEIKAAYPQLDNQEILNLMLLKTIMEIKVKI